MLSPEQIVTGLARITGHAFEHLCESGRVFVMVVLQPRPNIDGRPFDMFADGTAAGAGFVHVEANALIIDFDEEETGYNDLALYASRDEIAEAIDKISLGLEAGIVHGFHDGKKKVKKSD
jgi:hypothetical protein